MKFKILREYEKKDPRVKVITRDRSGYGQSVNECMDLARGEYIGWCDSDDWVEPTMYEEMVTATQNGKIDNVISNFIIEKKSSKEAELHGQVD